MAETKTDQRADAALYTFDRSVELFERATKVIPCGIYGHHSPAIRTPGATPYYFQRGQGSRIWDVDGNEYVDWICAYGPMLVGYNHPKVEAAAAAQREKGDCLSGPSPLMVELAERLVQMTPFADWFVFAKNGSDMTTWAVQVARAHTGRNKILMAQGAYHGKDPWCTPGHAGLVPGDREDMLSFRYNDLAGIRQLADRHRGKIAAVILTPYHFTNWQDSEMPVEAFWQGLRKLCDDEGIVLILDDVRTCFRLHMGGSGEYFGVKPDLSAYCKAIANGYALSACGGRQELKTAASKVFLTGSYWFSAVPMAAAMATLDEMEACDGIARIYELGTTLCNALTEAAASHGLQLACTGHPSMPMVKFAGDDDMYRTQVWCAEVTRRGAYVHPHHNWFVSTAHTQEDIKRTLDAAEPAFAVVKERFGS
ncbi:MAG: aminotransferase class III-fold pyridoxal phosphate-dependent enzyme [Phycisphaerae bacterium]|nr:aminotransferase class III-fold pyridoxal phosphate-dependent enzyme [Phycisphaerae bacterium]